MRGLSLRQARVFLAVANLHSLTAAAQRCHVSQPAVSQALAKLERQAGGALFDRTGQGLFPTERGRTLAGRLHRAMARLDGALAAVGPRLCVTATVAQLRALIAVAEAQNFTLAARALGLAQPTVHRAVSHLEQEAGRPLFEKTAFGFVPLRACTDLAQAARLAFSEFAQIEADLAEVDGRVAGTIVVGALPLSRSVVLPEALARFRAERRDQGITVLDGPYDDMLAGLRRGDIDLMIGALRDPVPIADVVQEVLFEDGLTFLARPGHPFAGRSGITPRMLRAQAWVVPRRGTPARAQFDAFFGPRPEDAPDSLIDCGSILLMRELLRRSTMLGCISRSQAAAEIASGQLVALAPDVGAQRRPIGLTRRRDWVLTAAQARLMVLIREAARAQAAL